MDIIEYLNKHGILWEPLILSNKVPVAFDDFLPKTNDYHLEPSIVKERQKKHTDSEYIAIFTDKIAQIDIDDENFNKTFSIDSPYFLSCKKRLKHYFVKVRSTGVRKEFLYGDLLTGQWSFCKRGELVQDSHIPIASIKIKDLPQKSKKSKNMNVEKVREIFDNLRENYSSLKYPDWFTIICGIYNVSVDYGLDPVAECIKYSENSNKYDEKAKNTINKLKYDPNGVNIGSLMNYFKEKTNETKGSYEDIKSEFEKLAFFNHGNRKLAIDTLGDLRFYSFDEKIMEELGRCGNVYNLLNKKIGSDRFFDLWFEDTQKRNYIDIDSYPPPTICPKHIYNSWRGFENEKFPELVDCEETYDQIVSYIKEFINFIACDIARDGDDNINEELKNHSYNYITAYIANIIQNPGRKEGIIFIFHGKEGTYKSSLGFIIKNMIKDRYFTKSDSMTDITHFNSMLDNKLFFYIEEIDPTEALKADCAIKNIVTDEFIAIRKKGIDSTNKRNYTRLMGGSNSDNTIKISDSSRRIVQCETTFLPLDLKQKVALLVSSQLAGKYMYDYFKTVSIPYNNMYEWQNSRPVSTSYLESQNVYKDKIYYFLLDNFDTIEYRENEKFEVKVSTLYEEYKHYMTSNFKTNAQKNLITFSKSIKKILKELNCGSQFRTNQNGRQYVINVKVLVSKLNVVL